MSEKQNKTEIQKNLSLFGENLGRLDLLPKLGYSSLETEIGDSPAFMSWGCYFIEVEDASKIQEPFCIVDNLDSEAKFFIIKDTRMKSPIVINHGPTPTVFSVAELRGLDNWFYVGLKEDRYKLAETYNEIILFAKQIYLVVGISPLQMINIEIDQSVKTEDDVYIAIANEHNKRFKQDKSKD